MAENTKIADHVWSPWLVNGDRRRKTSDAYWREPLKWNRKAADLQSQYAALSRYWLAAHGVQNVPGKPERPRVVPSHCDPFEDWSIGGREGGSAIVARL